MNKAQLFSLLNGYIREHTKIDDHLMICDITANLQDAIAGQLVFYRIVESEQAYALFEKRYQQAVASLVIVDRRPKCTYPNLLVVEPHDFLTVQKILLDYFFPMADKKMKLVGVTGTNGKTTTVNLAMQVAQLMGHSAISVGTVGINSASSKLDYQIDATTPSYIDLRKIVHRYQDVYEVMFLEISSHGLDQNRLFDLTLDAAGWTNLTQDHLDYHKNMENYWQAKMKIVDHLAGPLFFPSDQKDLYQRVLKKGVSCGQLLPALSNSKDLPFFFKLWFNQSNLQLALAFNEYLWNGATQIDLATLKAPPGRLELIASDKGAILIDYAHTPDALERVLQGLRNSFPDQQINLVFGCGGNRDRGKRKLMGQIAASLAHKIYITSDNPRNEAPMQIIDDIIAGIVKKGEVVVEVDRRKAIALALKELRAGVILLVAGKGHESYQEINGVRYLFDDKEEILKGLEKK